MNFKNAMIYRTDARCFSLGSVRVEAGKIVGFEETADAIDLHGAYLLPGMVDIHTHGRAGEDFCDADSVEIDRMARSYAEAGTTTVVPTLASAKWEQLLGAIARTAGREDPKDGGCRFLGVHLEGRYLSPVRRGAHASELLALPSIDELETLHAACGSRRLRISLAPELDGAREMIARARETGVQIGIAHTDATFAQAMEATAWGCEVFTHQFNAMRPFHHRDPGTVGAGLLSDAYIELICDGIHLHPGTVLLAHRIKSPDKILLVTDSMAGAGCPDGTYSIAGLPVTVRDGKAINSDGAIAGSTLNLLDGMLNYAAFCGISLEQAIPAATIQPARCAGIADSVGSIEIGKHADFVALDRDGRTRLFTAVGGQIL